MTIVNLPDQPEFDTNNPASFLLDLDNPKPKEMLAIVEFFAAIAKSETALGALPVRTGWNEITPTIAVNMLSRNRPGANRKVNPATVFYYARQMKEGRWKKTGQPVLVDAKGILQDAQHRIFAGLISGVSFPTFVVTEIDPIEGLFAYIDNGRTRTAATALQTSGLNGVSPTIVKVIKIAEEARLGVYNPAGGLSRLPTLSPSEVLELSNNYPNARKAARSATSDWEESVTLLGDRKDIVAWLGMRIIDLYGEEKADDFFHEFSAPIDSRSADDPFLGLRKLAEKDARADKAMKRHHMLAAMIKTFNAWVSGEPLGRRWMLLVDEDFPALIGPNEIQSEAAE